jgi:hypothetical protein
MMESHEERAAEAEYELSEMEDRSDKLAEDIEAAKSDWEQKKRDSDAPGAGTGREDEDDDDGATGEGAVEVEDESS